jgi:EmrB/QacA subfamily drug resistance transporter
MNSRDIEQESAHSGMWWVLSMTSICMAIIAYNTTALVTVLPQLTTDLDLRPATLQWVMAIYMVVAASFVPIMGRLSDLYGKINVFLLGIVSFAAGSLLASMVTDATWLLTGRALQGAGGASMFGTSLSVLTVATPESRRPFVMGLWGALIAVGMSLGPMIGGLFGEFLSWRWVFIFEVIMLAIAALLLWRIVIANYVPNSKNEHDSLDVIGAFLLVIALAPLAYGLSLSETAGWLDTETLGLTGFGLVAIVAFCLRERYTATPLLQIDYFRHPRYIVAASGMFIIGFVFMGFFIYYALYAQSPDTLAMSPVLAGASMLPMTGMMLVLSVVAPQKLAPYSFRWPITLGMLCLSIACYLMSLINDATTYNDIWWRLMLLGCGLGLTMPLLPRVGMRILAAEHVGQGSGTINTFLYFGATVGAVICGLAQQTTIKDHIREVLSALPVNSSQHETIVTALGSGSGSEVQAALAALGSPVSQSLGIALKDVRDDAFAAVMLACALITLCGSLLAGILMRGPVPQPESGAKLLRNR